MTSKLAGLACGITLTSQALSANIIYSSSNGIEVVKQIQDKTVLLGTYTPSPAFYENSEQWPPVYKVSPDLLTLSPSGGILYAFYDQGGSGILINYQVSTAGVLTQIQELTISSGPCSLCYGYTQAIQATTHYLFLFNAAEGTRVHIIKTSGYMKDLGMFYVNYDSNYPTSIQVNPSEQYLYAYYANGSMGIFDIHDLPFISLISIDSISSNQVLIP